MNHPTLEEWMSFLYGEDPPECHAERRTHLGSCAECKAKVNGWRSTAAALDHWPLPSRPRGAQVAHAGGWTWRWAAAAAAAAILLTAGIAVGRFAFAASSATETLRMALAREFDQKLANARADWAAESRKQQKEAVSHLLNTALESAAAEAQQRLNDYAREQEEQRFRDQEGMGTTLRQLDARYTASLGLLRKEIETVAVNTQDGFLETEQQLGQLASLTQAFPLHSK